MTIHQRGTIESMTFDGIIFDMDGTLIDSTPAVLRSWVTWGSELGLSPDQLQGFHGVPAASIVDQVLPEDQRADGLVRITELELADTGDIVVLPGAAEALAALAPSAAAAIATSCTRQLAEARLEACGLVRPEVLITIDDVVRGKPAPDPFLAAADRLGVDPARCLVVEDAPKGLQAGRAAGARTLAVVTTTDVDDLAADAIVTDLSSVRFVAAGSVDAGRVDQGITVNLV
ncbi:MAG: HAD-IA family hydrolase [Propionibacteriales bacterium]|nr:HAD-IA family hydrolase [Propionibacteriales bacterium]